MARRCIDPDVMDSAHLYNTDDVLAVLRKLYPTKDFLVDIEGLGGDLSQLDNGPGAGLLKEFGRQGWATLQENVKETVGVYERNRRRKASKGSDRLE
ncbi:MAG: hypothetical protein Q9186_005240 [Xanthomendoza sp. 1 TL-2023]